MSKFFFGLFKNEKKMLQENSCIYSQVEIYYKEKIMLKKI